jgi:hypothetical protein
MEFWPVSQLLKGEERMELSRCHRMLRVPKMALLGASIYERCENSLSCGRWMIVNDKS